MSRRHKIWALAVVMLWAAYTVVMTSYFSTCYSSSAEVQ